MALEEEASIRRENVFKTADGINDLDSENGEISSKCTRRSVYNQSVTIKTCIMY